MNISCASWLRVIELCYSQKPNWCVMKIEKSNLTIKRPPWDFMSSKEVAEITGVSPQSLANWRFRGKGPQSVGSGSGSGRSAYYQVAEVEAWLRKQSGEAILAWQVTAEWLHSRYIFPIPLTTEERTQAVVNQQKRWRLFPCVHELRHSTLAA